MYGQRERPANVGERVTAGASRQAAGRALFLAVAWSLACGCGGAGSTSSTGGTTLATTSSGGTGAGGTGGATSTSTPTGPVNFCKDCSLAAACTTFANLDLNETSGIVPSPTHDGAYYLHNDSGDSSRFFATNCAGDDLGTYEMKGAANTDWEDVALGPCGDKKCLFFADVGDNLETRTDYAVYRADEPISLSAGTHQVASVVYPFVYPDGSHDSETILIHPITGEMAVVTKLKDAGKSGVYAFPMPLTPGQSATLVKVGEVVPPTGSIRITSGDVHPKAEGILLRTYTSLFFYPMTPDQTIEAALAVTPCEMPVMLELQGESVTFTAAGTGYVTASEMTGQSLHFAACK